MVGVATVRTTRLRGLGALTFTIGAFVGACYFTGDGGIGETRMGHAVSGLISGLGWSVLSCVLLRKGSC